MGLGRGQDAQIDHLAGADGWNLDSNAAGGFEQRLRNLYAVVRLLSQRDSLGPAQDWLMQPNPELHYRAPAELLREGESPEPVWFAASPTF